MTRSTWSALCLGYIVGLIITNLVTIASGSLTVQQICLLVVLISGLTLISAIALRKKLDISAKAWIGVAIVAVLAGLYWQWRLPQPKIDDVVYQISPTESQVVAIAGKVITEPRLNASHKIKFLLAAEKINQQQQVSGKLYISLPLLQGTGINLGENIELRGILYPPPTATTPGGLDFKAYLANQGVFTGMQGLEVISDYGTEPTWGWWKLRRRIVRTHLQGLGSPLGQLVSSMVLGRKAVDLPIDLRDRFIKAGLAHVLAASGFHVSLLLGLVLKLTNRLTAKSRLIIGMTSLIVYLGLTGIQPSVLRACLMGSAVLIALALDTKVKPLGSLLLVATIILLFNPLLISDLGFQLSFLATLGLIVTMPALQAKLDWLPPTIATLVAVPLAASIWVLPLISYQFKMVATYSIIVNIICTPLIMVISLGGMISAMAGLILPIMGSAIAWLLFYPTSILVGIIDFFTNLPGSTWAIGKISLGVVLIIYGLFIALWLNPQWQKYWRLVILFVLTLIIMPIGYRHLNLTQITVLPTTPETVLVIQDQGKVILINSGQPKTWQYTVLPFLIQQGINHLDYYLDLNPESSTDLAQISDRLKIKNNPEQNCFIVTKTFNLSCDGRSSILKLETAEETWLISGKAKSSELDLQAYLQSHSLSPKAITIVSLSISSDWLQLEPTTIISSAKDKEILPQNLDQPQFYDLNQDGMITWTPQDKLSQNSQQKSFNSIF